MNKSQTETKFFLGKELHFELRGHLNKNEEWKNEGRLQLISHQGKDYIGLYITTEDPTMKDFLAYGEKIDHLLHSYLEFNVSHLPIYIFAQLFMI